MLALQRKDRDNTHIKAKAVSTNESVYEIKNKIRFTDKQSTMQHIPILFVICVTIGYVNGGVASKYGVDCRCTCCFPSKEGSCSPIDIGTIHLNQTNCNQAACLNNCDTIYFNCRGWGGNLTSTCSDTSAPTTPPTSPATTGSTATSATSSASTATSPTSSASTATSATSSASTATSPTSSASTATSPTSSASTTSTPTTSGQSTSTPTTSGQSTSTPTAVSTSTKIPPSSSSTTVKPESTTSGEPGSSTTQKPSSANSIKSLFQLSYFVLLTISLMFLCA